MEPAVSSLQPPAGSPQTGPAECAERLNPPPPGFLGRGACQILFKLSYSIASLQFQSPFPISSSNLNFRSISISILDFHPQESSKEI